MCVREIYAASDSIAVKMYEFCVIITVIVKAFNGNDYFVTCIINIENTSIIEKLIDAIYR